MSAKNQANILFLICLFLFTSCMENIESNLDSEDFANIVNSGQENSIVENQQTNGNGQVQTELIRKPTNTGTGTSTTTSSTGLVCFENNLREDIGKKMSGVSIKEMFKGKMFAIRPVGSKDKNGVANHHVLWSNISYGIYKRYVYRKKSLFYPQEGWWSLDSRTKPNHNPKIDKSYFISEVINGSGNVRYACFLKSHVPTTKESIKVLSGNEFYRDEGVVIRVDASTLTSSPTMIINGISKKAELKNGEYWVFFKNLVSGLHRVSIQGKSVKKDINIKVSTKSFPNTCSDPSEKKLYVLYNEEVAPFGEHCTPKFLNVSCVNNQYKVTDGDLTGYYSCKSIWDDKEIGKITDLRPRKGERVSSNYFPINFSCKRPYIYQVEAKDKYNRPLSNIDTQFKCANNNTATVWISVPSTSQGKVSLKIKPLVKNPDGNDTISLDVLDSYFYVYLSNTQMITKNILDIDINKLKKANLNFYQRYDVVPYLLDQASKKGHFEIRNQQINQQTRVGHFFPNDQHISFSGIAVNTSKGGTLITPQHILFANHYKYSQGSDLQFCTDGVQEEKVCVNRKVTKVLHAIDDAAVAMLDKPLDQRFKVYKFFENAYQFRLKGAPVILTKWWGRTNTGGVYSSKGIAQIMKFDQFYTISYPSSGGVVPFDASDEENVLVRSGDSGHPSFMMIDDEMILLETHSKAIQIGDDYYGVKGPDYLDPSTIIAIYNTVKKLGSN